MSAGMRTVRRWIGLAAYLVLAGLLVAFLQQRAQFDRHVDWGRQLYEGTAAGAMPALRGRLVGHDSDLPGIATRCINCHRPAGAAAGFGTRLDADHLRRALPRRGGPPSTYDAAGLCRVLREGIDPAFVVIDQAMPRYQATDAQCSALWLWLAGTADD